MKEAHFFFEHFRKLQDKLQSISTANKTLEDKLEDFANTPVLSIPFIKHCINLYASISCIRWMYDAENRIQGYITSPEDLKGFDFDIKEDPFVVANSLWEMI